MCREETGSQVAQSDTTAQVMCLWPQELGGKLGKLFFREDHSLIVLEHDMRFCLYVCDQNLLKKSAFNLPGGKQ